MNTPQYVTELQNCRARPLPQLHGRTPYEILLGYTPDVSEFLEFEWFQPIWYFDPSMFPDHEKLMALWIGKAHQVGQAMRYWVLHPLGYQLLIQ